MECAAATKDGSAGSTDTPTTYVFNSHTAEGFTPMKDSETGTTGVSAIKSSQPAFFNDPLATKSEASSKLEATDMSSSDILNTTPDHPVATRRRSDNNPKLSSTEANSVLTKPGGSGTLGGNASENCGPTKTAIASPSQPTDHHLDRTNNGVLPRPPAETDPTKKLQGNLEEKRELLAAFALIFVPMSVIAFTLIAFVYYEKDRVRFNRESVGTPELPALPTPPANAYYTTITAGRFLLLSSWASSAAGTVFAPFMLLFSFVAARELARRSERYPSARSHNSDILKEILNGSWIGVLHLAEHVALRILGRGSAPKELTLERRATHIAALGLCATGILLIFVLIGDNWLHFETTLLSVRYFEEPTYPARNPSAADAFTDVYAAGWTTSASCALQLVTTLPQNRSNGLLPCSLNGTNGLNVVSAPFTYLTLENGISQVTSGFNTMNFTAQGKRESEGTATNEQIITYNDSKTGLSHSMLFYPDASQEIEISKDKNSYGIDYVANTTSMVTQCSFVTQDCNFVSKNASTVNTTSIPYNCSAIFAGDLAQTPAQGLERANGWNMSFYELVNGTPSSIPYQAQANPFLFNAAAAVSSLSSGIDPTSYGDFVDAGQGRTAFALACNATVYDVQFAMFNGSITAFNATPSDPRKANIVQAPLQIGVGQFRLHQAATAAAIANLPFPENMAESFSQVGMAAASGAFFPAKNEQQRFRYDVTVTQVPFHPFWFLVVSCLVYSACGLAILGAAFWLRRDEGTRERQSKLMPNPDFEQSWEGVKLMLRHPWETLKEKMSGWFFAAAQETRDPEGDREAGLNVLPLGERTW